MRSGFCTDSSVGLVRVDLGVGAMVFCRVLIFELGDVLIPL